jgi:hypothetical protein
MEDRIKDLESEINILKERNRKVELNKAWETSAARKAGIAITTYFVMCLVMLSLGTKEFYLSAIIPTLGFLLSTLSLNFLKNTWLHTNNS